MPVIFVPTPPRYFFLPRVVTWLPNEVFLPLTSHSRPSGATPSRLLDLAWLNGIWMAQTFSLAMGLCGLLRWMLPHSSTRSQTLWGGTASLHWGQTFRAMGTSASWLRRIPFFDFDVRLFGTPTTPSPAQHAVSGFRKEDHYPPISADCKAGATRG